MPIPDYETLMLPLLKLAGEKNEIAVITAVQDLAASFKLSKQERTKLIPSGRYTTVFMTESIGLSCI